MPASSLINCDYDLFNSIKIFPVSTDKVVTLLPTVYFKIHLHGPPGTQSALNVSHSFENQVFKQTKFNISSIYFSFFFAPCNVCYIEFSLPLCFLSEESLVMYIEG